MPLHLAVRYIARDSAWAADYPPSDDSDWIIHTDFELMSKLNSGALEAFALYKPRYAPVQSGMAPISKDFLKTAQWNSHHMATADPPTHRWSSNDLGIYMRVTLSRRQVEREWPPRSLWAKIRKHSPVERLGCEGVFAEQDKTTVIKRRPRFFDKLANRLTTRRQP